MKDAARTREDAAAVAVEALPETIEVALCGKTLHLPAQIVVDSMVKQLAKHATSLSLPQDEILDMFQDDVAQFLRQQLEEFPESPFPLFEEKWEDDFFAHKALENRHLCQDVIVEFADGSQWKLRALDLALLRAEHLLGPDEEDSEKYTVERDLALKDPQILLDWISGNLAWEDVSLYAEEIRRPQPELDYAAYWPKAPKHLQPWDNSVLLLAKQLGNSEDE